MSSELYIKVLIEKDFIIGDIFTMSLVVNNRIVSHLQFVLNETDQKKRLNIFKNSEIFILLTQMGKDGLDVFFRDLENVYGDREIVLLFDIDAGDSLVLKESIDTQSEERHYVKIRKDISYKSLINPEKIAIIGVSSKEDSFGHIILKNLLKSKIDKKNLRVIKPGVNDFLGIKTYEDVSSLKDDPVDMLIVVLPSLLTLNTILEICNQGKGAEYIYLVAGGIGDQADKQKIYIDIINVLNDKRNKGEWTPSLIGPNSLGIIISPLKINTMFISEERVKFPFAEKGNIALLSQSGAFLLTRYSNNPWQAIKYGFCIGNQIDLNILDFMDALINDDDINVIAIYLEGLGFSQGKLLCEISDKMQKCGKQVVIYIGGRNKLGSLATRAHTGSISGNYEALKNMLQCRMVYVAQSLLEFSDALKWFTYNDSSYQIKKVAMLSNAGYETTRTADVIGDNQSPLELVEVSTELNKALKKVIRKYKLQSLVAPANPFDITPMACELAYQESIQIFCKTEADIVIVSIVPFTERIKAFDKRETTNFAKFLKELSIQVKKPIVVVIEAGENYNSYKNIFSTAKLPVYNNIDECLIVLNKCARLLC